MTVVVTIVVICVVFVSYLYLSYLYRTVAVTIVVVCAVGITLCMVLYCCCCQKRPGIHEGKLIWIKRKKDKIGNHPCNLYLF